MNDAVNPGTMTNGTSAPERSLLRQPGRAAPVGITRAVDNLGMPEGRQSSPRSTPCRDGGSCWEPLQRRLSWSSARICRWGA